MTNRLFLTVYGCFLMEFKFVQNRQKSAKKLCNLPILSIYEICVTI